MITTVFVLKDARACTSSSPTRRKLDQMLRKLNIDLEHVAITGCKSAISTIEKAKPNIVVTMGSEAFKLLSNNEAPLGKVRGELLRAITGHKLIPTFSPDFVYKSWDNQETIEYDLRKAWATSHTPKMPLLHGKNYTICITVDEVREAVEYLKESKRFAWDWETEGFDVFDKDELLCVQFATRKGEGIVIPLRGAWERHTEDVYTETQLADGFWRWVEDAEGNKFKALCKNEKGKPQVIKPAWPVGSVVCQMPESHEGKRVAKGHICRGNLTNVWGGDYLQYTGPGRMHGKFLPSDLLEVIDLVREALESDVPKIAHNGKFDIHCGLWQYGIIPRGWKYDTMLAFHNFHEKKPHRLEVVQSRYTNVPQHKDMVKPYVTPGKVGGKPRGSYAEIPNEVLWYYGAIDADVEYRLLDPLLEEIERDNPENGRWLFDNVDMPYNRALIQIETNGILVDLSRFDVLVKTYNEAIKTLKKKIDEACDEHNLSRLDTYNNPYTLRQFLYEKEYEIVSQKEKWLKCRTCKGTGYTLLHDEKGRFRRDADGALVCGKSPCPEDNCIDGVYLAAPEIKRVMRGVGLPTWGVPKTAKTDEEKTDKKAFTALNSWTAEDVRYTVSTVKGLPVRRATKTPLSPGEIAQRLWKRKLLKLISQYKQAIQARNLFLEGNPDKELEGEQAMLSHIRYDGRIHCTYLQLTTTARLSSSNPNLQNISNEDDEFDQYGEANLFYGYGLRTMFTAPPGYRLVEVDYSSQEMRVLAYLALEDRLMEVFMVCPDCHEDFRPTDDDPERPWKFRPHCAATGHKAQDLHQGTAAKVFKVAYDSVTKQQRTFAKRVNFGLNYGQGARGLAEVLGISLSEAQILIDEYMKAFPKIRAFQAKTERAVYGGKRVPNAYGRYRHNYGVKEMKQFVDSRDYEKEVSGMFRQCVNHPVQSSPADIMGNVAIALADVWGVEYNEWQDIEAHVLGLEICGFHPATKLRDLGVKMVNLVHDSCLFEIPDENYDEAVGIITTVMERLPWLQLGWCLPVDVKSGPYWGYHDEEEED